MFHTLSNCFKLTRCKQLTRVLPKSTMWFEWCRIHVAFSHKSLARHVLAKLNTMVPHWYLVKHLITPCVIIAHFYLFLILTLVRHFIVSMSPPTFFFIVLIRFVIRYLFCYCIDHIYIGFRFLAFGFCLGASIDTASSRVFGGAALHKSLILAI